MEVWFLALTAFAALLAGGTASIAGFGIGSIMTPELSLKFATKMAVASVAIPHFVGTAIRCFHLRKNIDRGVLYRFGITSAIGGLSGAALFSLLASPPLTLIFGIILIVAGFLGASGVGDKLRFHGLFAWIAGGASGFLGGLVGNQGGIRSAALLAFNLDKNAFVATATAIGLLVDLARLPFYLYSQGREIAHNWQIVSLACLFVAAGTIIGMRVLKRLDEKLFKRCVSTAIIALGIWMILQSKR